MPFCSTFCTAFVFTSSSFSIFAASSSVSSFSASLIFTLRRCFLPLPRFENIERICSVISSIPGGAMMSMPADGCSRSSSTSLSSSWPSRRRLRKVWRVALLSSFAWSALPPKPTARGCGSRMSRMRSSAWSVALLRTLRISDSRVCLTEISIRSRTMLSTSRPT